MTHLTYHMVSVQGFPVGVPNRISRQEKAYYISYNNHDRDDYGGHDTTALYIEETGQFLILNGNHSPGYAECGSFEDCLNYFYDHIAQANFRSEHGKVFRFEGTKPMYVDGGY